uniref:Uncharacterized protein n=1 Tax=Oryza punctata TaxID=4537 RepID=A0A0E0KJ56_ORYPU
MPRVASGVGGTTGTSTSGTAGTVAKQTETQVSEAKSYGTELADPGDEFDFDAGPMLYKVGGYVEIANKNLIVLTMAISFFSNSIGTY